MRDRIHKSLPKRNCGVIIPINPLKARELGSIVVMRLEKSIGVGELLEGRARVLAAFGEHAPAVV